MKRVVTVLTVVVMLLTFSVQALAMQFVPSIDYKGAPELVSRTEGDKEIVGVIKDADGKELAKEEEDCIIVTPVGEAKDESELSKTYKELKDKGVEAFGDKVEKDLVVRDLFEVSSECETLKEKLPVEGNTIALTFKLNLGKKDAISAMIKVNGAWKKLPVVNNGDGTVTATFEELGIVAFLSETAAGPDTGDDSAKELALWIGLMVVSAGAIVALLVVARRKKAEK